MTWLASLLLLFILQAAAILLSEYKRPAKSVAWLSILYIFPIIGFVVYYFMAREYVRRKRVYRDHREERLPSVREEGAESWPASMDERLCEWLRRIPGAPLTVRNRVTVLTNAATTYDALLEDLELAQRHIHFEFYTIRDDETGRRFQDVLIRKAREGVQVRVIYDGMGSYQLPKAYVDKLKAAGCEVYPFLKPLIAFFEKRLNYRNHRKIVVVDGKVGFVGGINIGDEYLGGDPKLGFWRDTHLKLEGEAVADLQRTFLTDWAFVSGRKLRDKDLFPKPDVEEEAHVQIISSGPDRYWDTIQEMFFSGMIAARRRIYVATPYFIPDPSITMALKTAASSGADVRVILPYKGDSRIVQYASQSYMQELLQAGVRFYLYRKGFIHAKVILFDDFMATAGTANMDMRSFFSNFELNAVLFSESAIQRLEQDFNMDLQECEEVELAAFLQRPKSVKCKEAIARLLSPLF
ncbi:cardiolipin synthase [Paenibacillus ferrarius]|uniref:cardiolipin synthase n=1 Tax=Paenibacillus ferrarius TaxID=1469647 RepID=UPI003D2B3763